MKFGIAFKLGCLLAVFGVLACGLTGYYSYSSSRATLQRFLAAWQPILQATRSQPEHKGLIRWLVDVDPLAI